MLTISIQPLETCRLRLRRLTLADAPLFFTRLGSSEDVTKYMLWKPHGDIAESVASIQKVLRRYDTGESCRWAIVLKETDTLIGIIDLMPLDIQSAICTFAYMLGQDYWGNGYAAEALKAVLEFAFTECGAEEVQADHFAENTASGTVMQKAGMQYWGILPGKYEKNGISHDALQYRITREEWLPRQSR